MTTPTPPPWAPNATVQERRHGTVIALDQFDKVVGIYDPEDGKWRRPNHDIQIIHADLD